MDDDDDDDELYLYLYLHVLACFAWQMDRFTAPLSLCLGSVVPASLHKLAFFPSSLN